MSNCAQPYSVLKLYSVVIDTCFSVHNTTLRWWLHKVYTNNVKINWFVHKSLPYFWLLGQMPRSNVCLLKYSNTNYVLQSIKYYYRIFSYDTHSITALENCVFSINVITNRRKYTWALHNTVLMLKLHRWTLNVSWGNLYRNSRYSTSVPGECCPLLQEKGRKGRV